jgi:hypothetical protein
MSKKISETIDSFCDPGHENKLFHIPWLLGKNIIASDKKMIIVVPKGFLGDEDLPRGIANQGEDVQRFFEGLGDWMPLNIGNLNNLLVTTQAEFDSDGDPFVTPVKFGPTIWDWHRLSKIRRSMESFRAIGAWKVAYKVERGGYLMALKSPEDVIFGLMSILESPNTEKEGGL